jgi:DNA-binding beta-propeller fold protein YncE
VSNWDYGELELWSPSGAFLENYGYPGPAGTPTEPAGISVDPANSDLYVPDLSNDEIDVFNPSHTLVTHFGSSGSGTGEFDGPSATAFDATDDDLYVLDEGNDRVEKFTSAGSYLLSFGSKGDGNGQFEYVADSAEDTGAVGGLAVDPSTGDVYVTDANDNRVEVFSSTGQYLTQFGGLGVAHGEFQGPSDIAISSTNGNIYVTDQANLRVEIFHVLEPTTVSYTGPDSGVEGQPVALTAALSSSGSPLGGQQVTIGFGAESCNATTDSGGVATCTVTLSDAPGGGPYAVTTSFAGSGYYEPSADASSKFTVEAPSSSTGGGTPTVTTATTPTGAASTTTTPTTTGTEGHKPTDISPRVSAGTDAVILKLDCPIADRSCLAAITLETAQKVAVRVRRRLEHEIVTVGSGKLTISGGQRRTMTVRLDARGRALLVKLRTLKLRVVVSAHDAYDEPNTVSLRLELKAPHRAGGS